jgi:hypothetical protein
VLCCYMCTHAHTYIYIYIYIYGYIPNYSIDSRIIPYNIEVRANAEEGTVMIHLIPPRDPARYTERGRQVSGHYNIIVGLNKASTGMEGQKKFIKNLNKESRKGTQIAQSV